MEQMNFDGMFIVPNKARGDGLTLMWKNSSFVWVDSFSSYHIDVIINGGTEDAWRLIGFYSEPDTNIHNE